MSITKPAAKRWALLAVWACASAASAQTLLSDGQVAVSEADLLATFQRVPAETRKRALGQPEAVLQQAENVFVRRKLAERARAQGLDKDPVMAAQLSLMAERILSEAMLEKLDAAAAPNEATLEQLARAAYVADPQRFAKPQSVRASHILIKKDVADAEQVAEKLLADLKAGAKFEDLARAHSGDPGSAAKGGSLGAFTRGRMVKPFEDAAFALAQPGDLSGVVSSQFGFHIIRLDEKISAGLPAPYEQVKPQLINEARGKAVGAARTALQAEILSTVKPDQQAIEAFSAKQR